MEVFKGFFSYAKTTEPVAARMWFWGTGSDMSAYKKKGTLADSSSSYADYNVRKAMRKWIAFSKLGS